VRAAFCCLCLVVGLAWAQPGGEAFTLQVFSFGDPAHAQRVAERLRTYGFDAYTETPPGSRWVQVRIGCFSHPTVAEGLLQDVRARVSEDAFVVPFTPGAGASVCAVRDLGFIPPARWEVASRGATSVAFRVGSPHPRYLVFDGRWRVAQSAAELNPQGGAGEPAGTLPARYRATRSRGRPLVRADLAGGSFLVAAGELLWASRGAAVVQLDKEILALRLVLP
jgi:hypothetical protein